MPIFKAGDLKWLMMAVFELTPALIRKGFEAA
nr:MAG TPA: hypothetical protein [Caudoviricetes sp.]